MKHVGSILGELPEIEAEIRISKQQLKRVESIELVRRQRDERKQDLLFNSRPFLLCGLPIRKPKAGTLIHERRNGAFFLQVCAHPEFGLPYGQDRLVPIWVATQAVRLRSHDIRFTAAAEILEELGLPPDGIHYRRLMQSFQRVFASTIYFGTGESRGNWSCARFNFFERLKLWNQPRAKSALPPEQQNIVTLSDAFYREALAHPVPVEREVVRALAHSAGALDFYMWLVWRSYGRSAPQATAARPKRTDQPSGLCRLSASLGLLQDGTQVVDDRVPVLARVPGETHGRRHGAGGATKPGYPQAAVNYVTYARYDWRFQNGCCVNDLQNEYSLSFALAIRYDWRSVRA